MSLTDSWGAATPASQTKKNLTSVISGTGAYLASLDKTKHKVLVCTDSGSGFIEDHAYLCTADGLSVIDISDVGLHYHSPGTTDGGDLIDVYSVNWTVTDLFLSRVTDLQKANWIQTVTSTGTIEDATDGTTGERSIRLRPNGTSGSGSTISYPHLSLDFSKRSFYETKVRIETASSLAFHTGVNCDDVTAADSNTIKYNAEVCTTTNNNWFLRSADGSNKTSSDSGIAITTN